MTIRTIAHKRLVVGEKKQRFGFRKTILGLCGAILGSTLLMADAANNAHTVHAAEFDQDQAKSVQTKADAAKDNGASTDVSKASAKTPVEAKGNEGTNTANGLNGKAGQRLAKKEVSQLNSSLKQDEKAGADKNQGADKGATGTGADKSGSQLGSQTGAQGAGKGTQGTGTGADKGAQGDKSAATAAKAETTSASSSSATNVDSTNGSAANGSSATNVDSTSGSAANGSSATNVDSTNGSVANSSSATNVIKRTVNIAKLTRHFTQLKTNKASKTNTDNEALTHVTKDTFLDYFSLNGSATYDKNSGIVTITPDEYNKVGNFSLKSKIDMSTSFTLTGQVNLGSKPNGADGIGFAFHNGNTTDIGNAGGNLGIGGLQNALGFKLDTWSDGYQAPQSDKDGSQIDSTNSNDFGWNGDSMNAPYGTFVDTENEEVATKDGIKVQRWWAKDVDGTSQALSKSDVNGQFHDFTVDYDGDKRTLTIKYTQTSGKRLTWTTTVSKSNQAMAMIVSASTGGAKNLQQFEIMSFDFKQAATVNVKYVDTKGNQIDQGKVTYPKGANVNGTYTTGQLEIPNYKFVRMDDGTATGSKSLPATGTLTKAGDNGTVIYVYAPNAEKANVTYIDDTTGKTLSTKDLTGNYGSTDPYRTSETINGYESQGYQLVSDNYPTNGVVYNQDGTVQSFQVHLTHSTTPVGPNNPEKPGEPINPDNPNGPKWPDGTDKNSLTQTITRTVNYYDKQTKAVVAKQVTEQVTYNRTAIVDKVTGQIIGYSTTGGDTVDQTDGNKAWTAVDNKSDWDSVTSPDLSSKGYLAPDLATVAQQTVTPGDKDVTVNVYYDHDVVPVNPTNPQTPGEPINPDDPDSPKWPAGTDKDSLTTDVHQTIHYQYGDGSQAAPDKTDSTTFDHQVEIDKVTGEIVKDDGWTAENGKTSFDSKNSPVIPGYTASKPASDSVDGLTQDSKDNVQTIVYAKTPVAGGNVTAKYVDENGNPIADDVIASGNVGDPYSTTQKDVPGYTFKEVQGNPTGSFTDQDQTVTYVYTKNPATDNNGGTEPNQPGKPGNGTDTGNPSSNQPGNPSQPSNATNNGVINTSTNTESKVNNGAVNSPELPQTGENNSQSQTMSFIGILLAMFGSLLGFLGIKKRRND
ncbi:lectin-like domain-containing protein [Lactobacillus kefiranofaciens]|uniref:lectin-like domain-containing protein n=1 Tax=Lactobacillus kefiranofaciens TaxID=267818 RepID=UPI0006F145EC|nr:MucBP domain-containing protein [Lactobacillus kefiranofaciens]KRL28327.1 cell surface protein [Lactobacillus kefiranofaciens subsp. kefirgranum DSM 10550 = JCM 8572]